MTKSLICICLIALNSNCMHYRSDISDHERLEAINRLQREIQGVARSTSETEELKDRLTEFEERMCAQARKVLTVTQEVLAAAQSQLPALEAISFQFENHFHTFDSGATPIPIDPQDDMPHPNRLSEFDLLSANCTTQPIATPQASPTAILPTSTLERCRNTYDQLSRDIVDFRAGPNPIIPLWNTQAGADRTQRDLLVEGPRRFNASERTNNLRALQEAIELRSKAVSTLADRCEGLAQQTGAIALHLENSWQALSPSMQSSSSDHA